MIKAIVGAQWGDEGKGRIVDALAQDASLVVRYQGGNNAGHTVVVNGNSIKLHLLPSGVVSQKRSLIASGVVIDPRVLVKELDAFEARGQPIPPHLLGIDFRAHVIMPWHAAIDIAKEGSKGNAKIGTTGRGIGPVYEAKAARTGIRFEHLVNKALLEKKINDVYPIEQKILNQVYDCHDLLPTAGQILAEYSLLGEKLAKYECDASIEVANAVAEGKNVLFEGAQGIMLDNNFGTYPFVTSSQPVAAGGAASVGIGPQYVVQIEGVAKAYTTRVGSGPFPTELPDKELAHKLREKGAEYGTTTGRPRRVGWLDLTVLRLAARLNGLTGIHLTKLDVLGGFENLKIADTVSVDGKTFDYYPTHEKYFDKLAPNYVELQGFPDLSAGEWAGVVLDGREKGFSALPRQACEYVKKIEELLKVPIVSVSIGAERKQLVWRR